MSRKEFLRLVIERAGPVGALIVAPTVIDSFLIPPVKASTMYTINPMEDTTSMTTDTG